MTGIIDFGMGFGANLLAVVILVRFIYYPTARDKSFVLTFFVFNAMLYFVLSLLQSVEFGLGIGFGLFAIFSVLRYRTDPIPVREMTYLFSVIALPILNVLLVTEDAYAELAFANAAVVVVFFVIERELGFSFHASQTIIYEKIELIKPENRALLLQDLQQRTGLTIRRLDIGRIDFLRDVADITIYYRPVREEALVRATPSTLATHARRDGYRSLPSEALYSSDRYGQG